MSQMRMIIPTDTTVEEIHEHILDTAVEIANGLTFDRRIPRKWQGPVFMNGAPYNDGRLVLEIVEEYQFAPGNIKAFYRQVALQAIQRAIIQHQTLFTGLILGEAKAGRNYFERWEQAPSVLF